MTTIVPISIDQCDALIKAVTELRDAESHVCPYSKWQATAGYRDHGDPPEGVRCTCEGYDKVVDKLEHFKRTLEVSPVNRRWPSSCTAIEENAVVTISELRARANEWRREAEFFTVHEVDHKEEMRCYANADALDKKADALMQHTPQGKNTSDGNGFKAVTDPRNQPAE